MKLVKIPTIGDGSCFLHAVIQAVSPLYNSMENDGKRTIVLKIRKELSNLLSSKKDDGKIWYEYLSRGKLEELSNTFTDLKLSEMKKFLASNGWFSHIYVELVSEVFDIDIYIIDYGTSTLYNLGDDELFYKNRDSVIIGYVAENHFETLALLENEKKNTYFSSNSRIISKMKKLLYNNRLNKDQN